MHCSDQVKKKRLAVFQTVLIWVLLPRAWLEDWIPSFGSAHGVRYLLLLSWNWVSHSQLPISARVELQPPEPDSSVQGCAGTSPWQHLGLLCHRRKCFVGRNYQTCPRRNPEGRGKEPGVSAPWHCYQSGSEVGKFFGICCLTLHGRTKYGIYFFFKQFFLSWL